MIRVEVSPVLLEWARVRAGLAPGVLEKRFPRLGEWERGVVYPTLKQLEGFAKATHTPIGYFFLDEPPVEPIPIPDFRTMANQQVPRPSPDLLETIYICEQRQEWYRDFARSTGEDQLAFVGSATVSSDVTATAAAMRDSLGFDVERRKTMPTWQEALSDFVRQADAIGILVMRSGIVGSNTRRALDPQEFRGFALADRLAPIVFINATDTKSAQMFTLAHELGHVWLGQSALSNAEARAVPDHDVERWCNRVAAELLVPHDVLAQDFRADAELADEIRRLARRFKVSTLVVIRRIHDLGGITREQLWEEYDREMERLLAIERKAGGGGDFYKVLPARVSKRFAVALVGSTLEGNTLHRDALRMLGFSKLSTFDELGRILGVIA
jgi:Zn-dependent peptidase ImmA (M78 family)/transcriptional regulator with XRE-family HTH domain